MAKSILLTILPSLWIILFILITGVILKKVKFTRGLKSIALGFAGVVPAILTIFIINYLLGSLFSSIPLTILIIISALNEELFKLLFISLGYRKGYNLVLGLLVAGGFALGETLYLGYGEMDVSYYRSILTMPLHMVTSIFLSIYYKKRGLLIFLAALLIHIAFNLLITR